MFRIQRLVLAAVLSLSAVSCADADTDFGLYKTPPATKDPHLQVGNPVFIDEAFTAEETEAVLAAVADWNDAVPALRLHTRIGLPGGLHWRIRREYADGAWGSCCTEIRIDVDRIFDRGWTAVDVTIVAMHELGHALGLYRDGTHAESGLMVPNAGYNACIDAATLAEVCRVRPELCDGREHVTCESVK